MSLKRSGLLIAALAFATVSLLLTRPSAAEIEGEQQTSWGLSTFGVSRVVANYSSLGWALEEIDGTVFAGGNFLDVTDGLRSERQPYLAAFATAGGAWQSSFTPEVGGPILALQASPDGALFVGGEMDTWNGDELGAIVKIDPLTGDVWPGWNTRIYGGTSVVRDLSLGPDGWLYAVGTFTVASDAGTPRSVASAVRLDPASGAIDWSWLPQTNGGVWGVSASFTQPTVYLAGWNNMMAGHSVLGVGSSDAAQLNWTGFEINYPCCDHMYDVETTEFGTVFVAGEQHGLYLYDESNDMDLMISHVTSYDSRYQNSTSRRGGDYQRIERVGDRIYATCHCWGSHSTGTGSSPIPYSWNLQNVGGTPTGSVSAVIAYDALTGARDQAFNPYMAGDSGGWGVLGASDGCVWVTGGLNAVGQPGSQRSARDLVRLCDEDHNEQPPVVPAPVACVASFAADTVTVAWDAVAGAADYIIYRSVDGGSPSWRGRSASTSFVDTDRDAELIYFVATRDASQSRSELTECSSEVIDVPVGQLDSPANCVATIVADEVNVGWDGVDGAAEYVIYRSVDGGNQYWRGRVTETTFVDSNRSGPLTYYVTAKSPDRDRSDRAECRTVDESPPPEPIEITPVASCQVIGPAADNTVSLTWPAAGVPDALYVISRSVDGGSPFWRGRVSELAFADTLRAGEIEYFVEVKVGNDRSLRTACEPKVQGL